jgi:hypothetical protein
MAQQTILTSCTTFSVFVFFCKKQKRQKRINKKNYTLDMEKIVLITLSNEEA